MQPLMERLNAQYKGPTNSTEYNKLRETLYFDIINLYDIAARNQTKIEANMDMLITENYFLQSRLIQLEKHINNINYMMEEGSKFLSNDFSSLANFRFNIPEEEIIENRVSIDTIHRIGTLPIRDSYNKIYLTDTKGEVFLPESFVVEVQEGTDLNDMSPVEDMAVYNAFDGDPSTFWLREKVVTDSSEEVYVQITCELPMNIINHTFINSIAVHPCPEFSASIVGIEYKSMAGAWHPIPTYPTVDEVMQEIPEATRDKFIFPKIEGTHLRITLKQPYWFTRDSNRVFMYGLRNVLVEYEEYYTTSASIITEFNLAPLGGSLEFDKIKYPISDINRQVSSSVDNLINHELYCDIGGSINTYQFDEVLIAGCSRVFIKSTLLPQPDRLTPVLKSIGIEFDIK